MNKRLQKEMTRAARPVSPGGAKPTRPDLPPEAEDALALAFAALYADELRYVEEWGKWLRWDGVRWAEDKTGEARDLIRQVCREQACLSAYKAALALGRATTTSGVERLAKTDRRFALTADRWDKSPWLLNTPAGVVQLDTGAIRPHRRDDLMTKCTAVAPGGDCPLWRAFLHEITKGDVQLESFLQTLAGYVLTGVTRENMFFFLYGTGANGKSVFVNTMIAAMGDYARTAPMATFMSSHVDRHPTELAMLRGSRLVSATETEEGKRFNEALLKQITGGELIAARLMRQDFTEYVPQFKLIISGNHKPALRAVDEAMRRRIVLIPFLVTIPPEQRDKDLPEKLRGELPGILNWMIAGAVRWAAERLRLPAAVRAATDEYMADEDTVSRWIAERCVIDRHATTPTRDLYADWKQFCEENGEYVISQKAFVGRLLERPERFEKWRAPEGRRNGLRGIALVRAPRADEVSI